MAGNTGKAIVAALLTVIATGSLGDAAAGRMLRAEDDPQDRRTHAKPVNELDSRFLRTVFLDLLGRPPFQAERDRWLGQGLRALLKDILDSSEFWRWWVDEQLYYFMLIDDFRPDPGAMERIALGLLDGTFDVRQATHRFCLTPSFELRNPGADTFVTVVLEQLTGLSVQENRRVLEIGKHVYEGGRGVLLGKTGESQADVITIAVESRQFSRHFLAKEYGRYLHGEPDRREFARWARRFNSDPREYVALVDGWFQSPAYAERRSALATLSNRLFIRSLFVDLLDRLPELEETEALRSALDGSSDPGPLRSIVARLLLDSGMVPLPDLDSIDPVGWIEGMFRRLYGRLPTDEQRRVFSAALQDPEVRTATVVYALVSHPDYQTY